MFRKNLQKELHNNDEKEDLDTTKKRYMSPEERKQIIEELRLVPEKHVWIKMHIPPKWKQIIDKLKLT